MVENIIEELETVENPNEFVFPKLTFTEDEYNQTLDIFRGAGGGQDPVPNFVKAITNELSLDYPDDPNFVSEKALKDGTATIFNFIPNLSTLPPKERRLSNEQIVRLLVQDTEGRPATEGSLIRGFGRKAPTGAASAVAFLKGAQAANVALSGVPPVGPGPLACRNSSSHGNNVRRRFYNRKVFWTTKTFSAGYRFFRSCRRNFWRKYFFWRSAFFY